MTSENRVLALVTRIKGDQVKVVRAFDGEEVELKAPAILGSTGSLEKTLNGDKRLLRWKFNTLDGIDPHLNPPGVEHPMLSLGLGELDDEILENIRMAPHMRVKRETRGETGVHPVEFEEGANGIEDAIRERDAKDNLEDVQNYFKNHSQKIVMKDIPSEPQSEPNSTFLMIFGAVIVLAYFNT